MGKIYQLMYFTQKPSGEEVQTVFSTSEKEKYEQQLNILKNKGLKAVLSFIANENEEVFGDVNNHFNTIKLNY